MVQKSPFSTVKPDHLYAISKIVAHSGDPKPALDEITNFLYSTFIFDNLVLYHIDPSTGNLEVFYARAMGRGRSAEADIAWGEMIANAIIQKGETILQEPVDEPTDDRLNRPYLLGVPLQVTGNLLGTLVFIRFGSPAFQPEEVVLAEFIGQQIGLLLERYNLEAQLKTVEAQNQQARLQESFISTITHELRSPLGFIKGYTTTLLRSDMAWDHTTQQEFLNIIDQETDHLEELIENLLDSARLQSGQLPMQFQLVRLDGLLNDVVARAHLHHPNLTIYLETAKSPAPIQGDPRRLAQVFENILSNAVKYAPGSPVWIKIQTEKDDVYITVRDEGPGVPEKYLKLLFERFFRNPEQTNAHGSGLGLFICDQIIRAHNGQIYATSEVGEGITFHIKLPMHQTPPANANEQPILEVKR